MKKQMFYESPVTMIHSIESEGVLCGSTFESINMKDTAIDYYEEIEW